MQIKRASLLRVARFLEVFCQCHKALLHLVLTFLNQQAQKRPALGLPCKGRYLADTLSLHGGMFKCPGRISDSSSGGQEHNFSIRGIPLLPGPWCPHTGRKRGWTLHEVWCCEHYNVPSTDTGHSCSRAFLPLTGRWSLFFFFFFCSIF